MKEVYRRIPLTKGINLEEAEAAIKNPPGAQASYPFRAISVEDDFCAGPSRSLNQNRPTERPPTAVEARQRTDAMHNQSSTVRNEN